MLLSFDAALDDAKMAIARDNANPKVGRKPAWMTVVADLRDAMCFVLTGRDVFLLVPPTRGQGILRPGKVE
jgi:hypothetical protein